MTDQEFMQKYRDLEGRIKQLEAVINKIETDSEPELERATRDDYYYSIKLDDGCYVENRLEQYYAVDDRCYNLLNYFRTKKRAQEVCDKIRFLLKLERLHDIYCYDYKAEDDGKDKYRIVFCDGMYQWEQDDYTIDFSSVYFPTETIVQKVCDRLNKEREDYDNS